MCRSCCHGLWLHSARLWQSCWGMASAQMSNCHLLNAQQANCAGLATASQKVRGSADQPAGVPAAQSPEAPAGQLLATMPTAQQLQGSKDDWGFADLGDWASEGGAAPATGSAAAFSTGTADAFDFTDLTSSLEAAGRQQHQAATATAAVTHGLKAEAPWPDGSCLR